MKKSLFDPNVQQADTSSKVVFGLERISEVFKVLIWDKAKLLGLSPIQIQILIFIAYHKPSLCNVSHLAKEFNVTKPTISDAIKMLDKKDLIIKDYSSSDSRSYTILLSSKGNEIVSKTDDFAEPLRDIISQFEGTQITAFYEVLNSLIYSLNRKGILSVQRTCFGCRFYEKSANQGYCKLLNKDLHLDDLRLDCPEYESNSE